MASWYHREKSEEVSKFQEGDIHEIAQTYNNLWNKKVPPVGEARIP